MDHACTPTTTMKDTHGTYSTAQGYRPQTPGTALKP
jgi:hypothetical protein